MNNLAIVNASDSLSHQGILRELEALGYGEFLNAFPPHLIGTHAWQHARDNATPRLRLAIDMLLLGQRVEAERAIRILPSIERWAHDGIVLREADHLYLPSLALVSYLSLWLFVERPRRNPAIYIGHDTFGLTSRIRVAGARRALDLCAGPGTQGLYMAAHGLDVTAVECNIVAAEVARVNACVNGLQNQFTVRVGNLYDALPATTARFDLITANPPLLPFPADEFYPFVGHGGADGLAVTWRILQGLPDWLTDEGRAQIIGTAFSDGLLPSASEAFRAAARDAQIDIMMTVVGHVPFTPGTPTFEGLAFTAALGPRINELERIRARLTQIAQDAGATHLCYFSLLARPGKGDFTLLDVSTGRSSTLWFVE